ncbi:hypothetical protein AAGT00_15555 [Streptomyces cavourensis]
MTTPFPSRPLTPAQHGLWVTEQVLAPGAAHHLALTVRFPDPPDPATLAARCARLLERQPVLRSRVDPDGPRSPRRPAPPPSCAIWLARPMSWTRCSRRRAPGRSTWPRGLSYGSRW